MSIQAQNDVVFVDGSGLNEKLDWLTAFVKDGGNYVIELDNDENIESQNFVYGSKSNITITIRGLNKNHTITHSSGINSMFTVGSGVSLIVDENIILKGSKKSDGIISINTGGIVTLNDGATITGNGSNYESGGVKLRGGTFIMNGGKITNNTANGVLIRGGTFTFAGGEISNNSSSGIDIWYADATVTMSGGSIINNRNGGVSMGSGSFNMSGGSISGNTKSSSNDNIYGGGVSITNSKSIFTMTGGIISGNKVSGTHSYGGGVSIGWSGDYTYGGTFIMKGGEISNNIAGTSGGGVYVGSIFTLTDGSIFDNTASTGGGVSVKNGAFTINGGFISENTASENGGGVYVFNSGIFTKKGGVVTGYKNNNDNGNVVRNNSEIRNFRGHAIYAGSPDKTLKIKEVTSEQDDDLSFSSKTISGAWDN